MWNEASRYEAACEQKVQAAIKEKERLTELLREAENTLEQRQSEHAAAEKLKSECFRKLRLEEDPEADAGQTTPEADGSGSIAAHA
eukprot:678625-Alexandrium_andersonii.AAC.1